MEKRTIQKPAKPQNQICAEKITKSTNDSYGSASFVIQPKL